MSGTVAAASDAADDAALAAALLWIDPHGLGGAWVRAGAGPARDAWLDVLSALRPTNEMPLVRMPASIADDRLLGGLDLAATLASGRPVAQRGLLAEADGGLVVAAMAERLDAATAAKLASVLDRGEASVAREGIEARAPARIGLVALDEGEGDDERLHAALADRLAFVVDLRARSWRDAAWIAPPVDDVRRAHAGCPAVQVGPDLVEALVAAADTFGVAGVRAPLYALRACRAHAALHGRERATVDDASAAVRLVLLPRATRLPAPPPDDAEAPEPPPETDDRNDDPPDDPGEVDPADIGPLDDRLVEAALASLPADLLLRLRAQVGVARAARSAGRSGAAARSSRRGRPIGARRGTPKQRGARLALIDTLRAAAPWQRLRHAAGADPARIAVRPDDFHVVRYRERRATTTIFVLDASGSAALARLAEAKGAVELLLAECYVRRDEVAVLAFRGRSAELLLPPTRSLVRAKRCLAGLPGGGGTPLATGLDAALALADRVRRGGATPALVLLTDGRANVDRRGEASGREQAAADALAAARTLRAAGIAALVVDTSVRPEPAAARLAEAIGATYLPLPQARSERLARAAQALVADG